MSAPRAATDAPGQAAPAIRPARASEARACRILLPEMFGAHAAPDLLVAIGESPGKPGAKRLAGAAGLGTVNGPKPGFPLLVHVVPGFRRRGIGRALIDAAIARVRDRTTVLRALAPVPAGSQAAAFLEACGFDQYETIRHFEADGASFVADIRRLRQRLQEAGHIPSGARVVRLLDAPPAPVAALVARIFGAQRTEVLARLDPCAPAAYDLEHSVALLLDGAVRGALIYNWNGGVPEIEVRVVDETVRGTWANVLMLERATQNGLDGGATRFRFFADERLNDTMRLARRAHAEEIRVEHHYWRRLG